MKQLPILLAICLSLVSCATYKVDTSENFVLSKLDEKSMTSIKAFKVNDYPQGFQCFEPMMFALTLGLVPIHCVDDYELEVEQEFVGSARVTIMSGWIPLFMGALPNWKYGSEPKIPNEIIKAARKNK